jgi:DNA (cytosine-5)-methyltransferase 1
VLDSQWFGVPQRRKRIFVVGSLGSRSSPYRILSLAESLPWNPPPSRKAQQGIVGTLNAGSGVRRGAGINPGILTPGPWWNGDDVAPCLDSSMLAKQQMMPEKGRFAAVIQDVTPPLKAGGNLRHDESHDTYIPIAATLNSGGNQGGFRTEPGEHLVPIAYRISPNWGASEQGDRTASLAVRRLTPVECERLQGFPDGWTELGADGKRISNSQRYKMLGNAITVNVAEWLGHRIVTEGGR